MIAIPLHQSRVAPVLDWCSTILLIPKNAGKSWDDGERLSVKTNVFDLLRLLRSMDVSPIICGALSPNALRYGQHLGLELICGISGAIDEVVAAYRAGELDQPRFRLPGCRCPGRRRAVKQTESVVVVCFCPQCGLEVSHRRGVPCTQSLCRECGTPLVRKPPAPGPSL